jgi:hypothetical protein
MMATEKKKGANLDLDLDLDLDQENIFIQSNRGEKVFEIEPKAARFSSLLRVMFWNEQETINTVTSLKIPFKVSEASDENLEIIVNYLKQCGIDGKEEDPPDKPLPRNASPNVFNGNDYAIFRDILESATSDKVKITQISSLIIDIAYFDIIKFREKASAAMASLFLGKPIEEICLMVDYAETDLANQTY